MHPPSTTRWSLNCRRHDTREATRSLGAHPPTTSVRTIPILLTDCMMYEQLHTYVCQSKSNQIYIGGGFLRLRCDAGVTRYWSRLRGGLVGAMFACRPKNLAGSGFGCATDHFTTRSSRYSEDSSHKGSASEPRSALEVVIVSVQLDLAAPCPARELLSHHCPATSRRAFVVRFISLGK